VMLVIILINIYNTAPMLV